ncbi:MAG: LCP family protein [Lachnospiraceae bacterium]|nr:LCP family protein [Lachnospiraceae bacterium]
MNRRQRRQEKKEKKKMPTWAKAVLIVLASIIAILLITLAAALRKWQRADYLTADMFQANETTTVPVLKISQLDESTKKTAADKYLDSVPITFNGKRYKYNDNLINILVTGIDDYGLKGDKEIDASPYQADTIVLGTVDAVKKTVSFISIPRDTVTDIKVLDLSDKVASTRKGPIAIQHSFGTQGEKTNEAVAEAVSNLLYGVPIYRYVAVDITAIPDINDSLGGITVDIPEDLTKWNPDMAEGTKDYLLMGEDAVIFVARRDTDIDDSAMGRMKRQMQYMKKLFPAMKDRTAQDIMFPIKLYRSEADKVATNLTIDEMTYLAKLMIDLELDDDQIESVPGEMRHIEPGEIEDYEYEMGYIADEEALKQLVIDRFYVEADE